MYILLLDFMAVGILVCLYWTEKNPKNSAT